MKEAIILCEFFPNQGHKMLFDKVFNILSMTFDVRAFVPKCIPNDNYLKLNCGYYSKKDNIIVDNISCIRYVRKNVKAILNYSRQNKIDKIICLTYDDISMFFVSFMIPKRTSLFLMHHHNIDLLSISSFKRFLFRTYSARFNHIVLCDFIKKYIQDYLHVAPSTVFVWPHPSYSVSYALVSHDLDCVGISGSNDDELIGCIIEEEKKNGRLKANNLHVILKSHKYNYDNGYLKVFTGYLDRVVYDDYIHRANSIFVAFPLAFKYRMSATIMDSLCNNKCLIGTNIPVIQHCIQRYPKIVKLYNADSFVKTLLLLRNERLEKKYFEEFQNNHSDEYLSAIYSATLDGNINNGLFKCDF